MCAFLYVIATADQPDIKDMCNHIQSKFPDVCASEVTGAYMLINLCYK
jgi:hypothetical protein